MSQSPVFDVLLLVPKLCLGTFRQRHNLLFHSTQILELCGSQAEPGNQEIRPHPLPLSQKERGVIVIPRDVSAAQAADAVRRGSSKAARI
jgi:hypothetical protein